MLRVDLNCDLGESFGAYTIGNDCAVLPLITSANIACGAHAGDPAVMENTVALCKEKGVAAGAHPGFFDLMGFGRRNMQVSPAQLRADLLYQIGALDAFCRAAGTVLQHVKPHGALYNMAAKDPALAQAVANAVHSYDPRLILLAQAGSEMVRAAQAIDLPVAQEVFADRAYEPDGSLRARSKPGAMITDAELAAQRVIRMIREGRVAAWDGTDIAITADSVCVHGDGEKALAFVSALRRAFQDNAVETAPLSEVVKTCTTEPVQK